MVLRKICYLALVLILDLTATSAQSQSITSPLTSFYASANDTVHLFYINQNHIYEAYGPYGGSTPLQRQDLTAMASNGVASLDSALTSFYIASNTSSPEHVFFKDLSGHIHELYSDVVGAWHDTDLTFNYGGVPASTGSQLASFYLNASSPEHVFFTDANDHIREYWSDSTGVWHDHDLTAIAGAPNGGGLAAFAGNSQSPEHVIYTAGQQVHEMYLNVNDANWHDLNLSAMAGVSNPNNTSPLNLTAFYAGGIVPERVYYQDGFGINGGGSIHELYSDSNGSWHEQNLTFLAGGQPDAGDLASFSVGSSVRVVYLSTLNGDVKQLAPDSVGAWHDTLVIGGSVGQGAISPYITGFYINNKPDLSVFYWWANGSPFFPVLHKSSSDLTTNTWNTDFFI